MAQLTVASVERKTPKKEGGNPFFVVNFESGEEMTTFDEAFAGFGRGTVLDVEYVVKGKHINITKWSLIQPGESAPAGPGAAPAPSRNGGGGYKKDVEGMKAEYELKGRLQARERASIEGQTIFNGAIAVITCPGGYDSLPEKTKAALQELITEAVKWGRQHLQPVPEPAKTEAKAAQPPAPAPARGDGVPSFSTGVELVNYALKHGYTLEKLKPLGLDKPTEIKDVAAATAVLFPAKKPETAPDPNDPDHLFD